MLSQPLSVKFTGETSEGLPLVKTLNMLQFKSKNSGGKWVDIVIKQGFETDFASIPKLLRGALNPWKLTSLLAAILHDFLLTNPRDDFDRKAIDGAFRNQMKADQMKLAARTIRYLGVRIGSGKAFKEARASIAADSL